MKILQDLLDLWQMGKKVCMSLSESIGVFDENIATVYVFEDYKMVLQRFLQRLWINKYSIEDF